MDSATCDDLRLFRWVGFFLPSLCLAVFAPWNPDLTAPTVPVGDERYELGNVPGCSAAVCVGGAYVMSLGAHLALCLGRADVPRSGTTPTDSD